MHRFKNILVVYNGQVGDEATLNRATVLARRNAARLTVVEPMRNLPDQESLFIEARQKQLERLIAPVRQEGIRATATVLTGIPFIEIIRKVLRRKHDLVMMTADGKGMLLKLLFGSTSMHLMRKCPCPVWVTKPTQCSHYARILAAVDPLSSDVEHDALHIEIMDLATSLARLEKSELHIVHTWEPTANDLTTSRLEIAQAEIHRLLLGKNRNAHKRQVERLLGHYPLEGLRHQIHIIRGEPGLVIPDLVAKKQIELIIMGTVCRTDVPGFFIGNTAETVLRQVDCAVLAVKPAGFVTPVTI